MGNVFVFLLGLLSLYSNSGFAQQSIKEIDLLVKKGRELSLADKSHQALKVGAEIVRRSNEINYTSGIIRGNTLLAYEFRMVGDYGRSLVHANMVWNQYKDSVDHDPKIKAMLLFLIGNNYVAMGLKKEAIAVGRKFIAMTYHLKDSGEAYNYRRAGYSLIYSCYKNENSDSVYYYLMKAKYWDDAIERLYPSSTTLGKTTILFSIANYYIDHTKNYDSAYFYINKGLERNGSAFEMAYKTDQLIGKILFKQGKYKNALPHLVKALKDAKEKSKSDEITAIYLLMSEVYGKLGDSNKAEEYKKKSLVNADSVQNARKVSIQASVELVKHELESDIQKKHKKVFLYLTVGLLTPFFAIGSYLYIKSRKKAKKFELRMSHINDNQAFSEVIDLAKANDAAFLARFKKVYPQFCQEMLTRYPDMLSSELLFCAYLKLNFTTKDIATYTYVTPSAVRNRKNRMKKKFGIPAHADIYAWIDKIPG
ncbi:tetratricopeptide repeat protein [Sphingobacterium ginsenosidimutans]|uniref:HTH luxR-type domain-containing protein n=1 Tax=Sphingobacterium ginsenosidimutans TaxID=687845 RepID=A0ABP7ZQR9_9SPHI